MQQNEVTSTNRIIEALRRHASHSALIDKNSLEPRKREELDFHDRERDETIRTEAKAPNKKFYSATRKSLAFIDEWLGRSVKDKVFLDYGCGNGAMAVRAASLGAAFAVGIDISGVSVENAKRMAAEAGVSDRCLFLQADCEDTQLPAESFDAVMCGGMLHHVDLTRAYPELRRIMRPNGRALAVEALGYNPLIQLYRWLTPGLRTAWESQHILSLSDVTLARRFFVVREVRHWHLFSIASSFARDGTAVKRAMMDVGDAIDEVVLRIPGVRLMSWQFSFEMIKDEAHQGR